MNHYDGTAFRASRGEAWTKCYGPWLLYVNAGASADDCWRAVQARGRAEAAAWPYPWATNPAYPKAATDWVYARTVHKTPDGSTLQPRWRVHCTLASAPAGGDATLVLSIAGADHGRIGVDVNGESAAKRAADVTPT